MWQMHEMKLLLLLGEVLQAEKSVYYELIEKRELSDEELSILEDLMNGKTFKKIANERNVSATVIWNKRVKIQNRYFALYEK